MIDFLISFLNRKRGGGDVMLPPDLMIVDSEYTVEQKVIRKSDP